MVKNLFLQLEAKRFCLVFVLTYTMENNHFNIKDIVYVKNFHRYLANKEDYMQKTPSSCTLKMVLPAFFILTLFATGFTQTLQNTAGSGIAVLPLRTQANITTAESTELTEWILFKTFNLGMGKILGLAEINALAGSDSGINLQTCSTDSCIYAAGARLNVRRIVWGTVESNDFHTTILLYLGDVSEKRIMNTVAKEVKGPVTAMHAHIPEILSRLFNVSAVKTESAPASPVAIETAPTIPALSTIELKSDPTGAEIKINGTVVGTTPFKYDSLQSGLHDITIDLEGYKQFSKKLSIPAGTYKKYVIKLIKKYGALTVLSTPSGASVAINQDTVGTTPYNCDTLVPGTYTLDLSMRNYLPQSRPVTVIRNQSDTVSVNLVSVAFADSIKRVNRHKRQIGRRIIFGALAAGFGGIGLMYNYKVIESLDEEQAAYDKYNQPSLSASEYSQYYAEYEDAVDNTGNLSKKRNAWYVVGTVFAVGFAVSIPF